MVLRSKWHVVISFLLLLSINLTAKEPEVIFSKEKIKIGHKTINVEVAKTELQHQRGLMFRTQLPKDEGMLFVFEQEQNLSFWMKNTYIDLAIAYFDKNKKIVKILEMKGTNSMIVEPLASYPSESPAQYALEMNKEWFVKNKIKIGDQFVFLKDKTDAKKSKKK